MKLTLLCREGCSLGKSDFCFSFWWLCGEYTSMDGEHNALWLCVELVWVCGGESRGLARQQCSLGNLITVLPVDS